ncbi:MAG: 4Fe-4S ferredoxin, partial [Dehalococcoidales bacterium]|nr:4Fe-4S ferredoxin [Dehalococcoidales bacterium]
GACETECKNNAISVGETSYVINPDKCTECVGNFESPKCAEVWPVDACIPDPDHKENKEQLVEKWRRLHPGETPDYVT